MLNGEVGALTVTFPPAVRAVSEQKYAKAKVILEYGPGEAESMVLET